MFSLKLSKNAVVGVDIQSHEIRVLKLLFFRKKQIIDKASFLPLPKDAVVKGVIQYPETVFNVLRKLVEDTEVKDHKAIISFPLSSIISQEVKMNAPLTSSMAESWLQKKLPHFFKGVTDTLSFDYIKRRTHLNDSCYFLVAAKIVQLKEYVKVVEAAGLEIKVIDLDLYALARIVQWYVKKNEGPFAIVDFCSSIPFFLIIQEEKIIFFQSLLSFLEEEIVLFFKKAWQQFLSFSENPLLREIIWVGEITKYPLLQQYIQQQLLLKIRTFCLSSLFTPASFNAASNHLTRYVIALGLALRGSAC